MRDGVDGTWLSVANELQLDIQIPTPQIGFIQMDAEEDERTTSAGTDRQEYETQATQGGHAQ